MRWLDLLAKTLAASANKIGSIPAVGIGSSLIMPGLMFEEIREFVVGFLGRDGEDRDELRAIDEVVSSCQHIMEDVPLPVLRHGVNAGQPMKPKYFTMNLDDPSKSFWHTRHISRKMENIAYKKGRTWGEIRGKREMAEQAKMSASN